ncbi:glycine oxidase ThiO [Ornithinibacillus sp. L9]|uniref:glycine oxidase n=1 Tax=Ornithinibacillus caprae TaxID=2678566 RepID=A0A6N8FFQ6_9BACI|nr:glycine oxidase ThiO [Ornithinibacillus caprae]MUK87526.1 glycine oxidase ThiO [Ornithinibacillus caprae]
MPSMYDAIIVGGGINGGSIAYSLAKRGKKVLLLEKDRLGSKSSNAAAGMLAAQAELNEDGPLFQLAKKSRAMFPLLAEEIKELSGIDIELVNKGMYKIALSEEEEHQYKQIIDIQRQTGELAEWITGEEVRRREPSLSEAITGAVYIEKDGQVSAPKLTLGFLKAAAALGVEIKEYTEVLSFHVEKGKIAGVKTNSGNFESETVIVAGGAWSQKILSEADVKLKTYPVKGECFSVLTHQPLINGTIFSHGCYLVPKKGGRLLVGATVKPNTFDQTVTVDGIGSLMEKAKKIVPSIVNAEWEKAWAGIRPQTSDSLPYLGEHPNYKGLFIATGHFRNGILLSPITGEMISNLIDGESTPIDLTAFRIDRHVRTIV